MATTLIDTHKSIMEQIHTSWNESRSSDETMDYMFGPAADYNCWHNIPLAKDLENAPWSTKQSVLEKNRVYANKLIRLYISLNIYVKCRMHIWQFFEIGVVGRIKEEIKLLKQIQNVKNLEQQLELQGSLPNTTFLFTNMDDISLEIFETGLKFKVKEAMAKKRMKKNKKRMKKNKKRIKKE